MSERYTRLFTLPKNLNTEGAPIVIAAGALLKDNDTDDVLAQIKFKNISEGTIKAVKVSVQSFDQFGAEIKEVPFEYTNLSAKSGEEFGSRIPVFLNNDRIRSYSVLVTEVAFENGSVWQTGADTAQAKKAVSGKVQKTFVKQKKAAFKKVAWIPLAFAVVGIVFSIIATLIKWRGSNQIAQVVIGNIDTYIIALIFPMILLFLPVKAKTMKTFNVMMIVGFILLGIQILASAMNLIVLLSGVSTVLLRLITCIPGSELIARMFFIFGGRTSIALDQTTILSLISPLCFFAKTIAGIILLKRALSSK
ncbi:MAG: hypothetical protein ACI4MR_06235 [Candidatus Aphodomorpha sp.]